MESRHNFYESAQQLPPEDLVGEEIIEGLRLMAVASRSSTEYMAEHPASEDERHDRAEWNKHSLSLFFENENHRPLILQVGRSPIKAYEIRPIAIESGELSIYDEIWLPPGFCFEITGIYQHRYTSETYLINPERELAHQADSSAQEYTGIAVSLEQIDENWQPQNGGYIIFGEPGDLQTRAV